MSDEENDRVMPAQPNAVPTMAMPWFMALPFIPKFSGKDGDVKFGVWVDQIESMLRAQGLDAQQKVDFLLWGLDGVAKRQVMLLDSDSRGSSQTILTELKRLYGQPSSLAHIRVQFFQCRQREGERMELYMLRFRELLNRWKESEPGVVAQVELTTRDQFIKGLRPGKVQRKMERLVRQRPALAFSAACTEALALEKESDDKEEAQTARVHVPPTRDFDISELNRWKEEVKTELRQEMHDHLATISKTLVDEVRKQLSPTMLPPTVSPRPHHEQQPSPRGGVQQGRYQRMPRSGGNFQWDNQGRPICRGCGRPGHTQRYCNGATRQEPLN